MNITDRKKSPYNYIRLRTKGSHVRINQIKINDCAFTFKILNILVSTSQIEVNVEGNYVVVIIQVGKG